MRSFVLFTKYYEDHQVNGEWTSRGMGEINSVYKILGGKERGRDDFVNLGVDGWVISMWILTKEDLSVDKIPVIQ